MRGAITFLAIGMLVAGGAGAGAGGCVDRTPPPQDVPVPLGPGQGRLRSEDPVKPMPNPEESDEYGGALPPPPFRDDPLIAQEVPEEPAFVEAYQAIGRPRIVVFVNRTLQGELLPVNDDDPFVSVERRRTARGDVTVESRRRELSDDFRSRDDRETTDRFDARGGSDGRDTAEFRDRLDVYLRPGQYDEVLARQVDYEAIENILTDVLSAHGRVEIVSPIAARRRLTESQVKDLEQGEGRALNDVARTLDADVLVHVTARPTRQTRSGLYVRLVAEAVNSQGGQSIGRGVVEIPPPLDKPRINRFSRFLARKLMDGMIGSWESMASARGAADRDPRRGPGDDRDAVDDRDVMDGRDAIDDRGPPAGGRGDLPPGPRGGAPYAEPPPASADDGEEPMEEEEPADFSPAPRPGPRPENLPPEAPDEPDVRIEVDTAK